MRLVLPEPDGPTMPSDCLAATLRSIPCRMLTAPASLDRVRRRPEMSIMFPSSIPNWPNTARHNTVWRHAAALLLILAAALPLSRPAAAETKILALGDSLTAGYGLKQGEGFADQLQTAFRKMGRPVTVINGGVSGDTSAGGLARIDWALGDQPQVVILELGANDMLRGVDPDA